MRYSNHLKESHALALLSRWKPTECSCWLFCILPTRRYASSHSRMSTLDSHDAWTGWVGLMFSNASGAPSNHLLTTQEFMAVMRPSSCTFSSLITVYLNNTNLNLPQALKHRLAQPGSLLSPAWPVGNQLTAKYRRPGALRPKAALCNVSIQYSDSL